MKKRIVSLVIVVGIIFSLVNSVFASSYKYSLWFKPPYGGSLTSTTLKYKGTTSKPWVNPDSNTAVNRASNVDRPEAKKKYRSYYFIASARKTSSSSKVKTNIVNSLYEKKTMTYKSGANKKGKKYCLSGCPKWTGFDTYGVGGYFNN